MHVRSVRGMPGKGTALCWKPGSEPDFLPELEAEEISEGEQEGGEGELFKGQGVQSVCLLVMDQGPMSPY